MSKRGMRMAALVLVVGLSGTAQAVLAAPSIELLANGGFEDGDFTSWAVGGPTNGIQCDQNFQVSSSGSGAGCIGFDPYGTFVTPASGDFAAYAAFDGYGPKHDTLTQSFTVSANTTSATLSWTDALGFGSGWIFPLARVYTVSLLDGSGQLVQTLYTQSFNNVEGGAFQNWTAHSVDLSPYLNLLEGIGAVQFDLFIPEITSGPGVYGLDDVSIIASVPEPETYAMMLAGLGLVVAAAKRRRG